MILEFFNIIALPILLFTNFEEIQDILSVKMAKSPKKTLSVIGKSRKSKCKKNETLHCKSEQEKSSTLHFQMAQAKISNSDLDCIPLYDSNFKEESLSSDVYVPLVGEKNPRTKKK